MHIFTVTIGFIILVMAIMIIVVNSIGIEGYNKLKTSNDDDSKKFVDSKGSNFNMLIISLICAIILLIVGCLMCLGGAVKGNVPDGFNKFIPVVDVKLAQVQ